MEPKNLLVVDDEVDVCHLLAEMLEVHGYHVVTETDPCRVLDLLREGDFDAALLDMVMPGLSGLELTARIREHFNVLPILVVTGYGSAEATVEAMRCGATDFVTKPVDAEFLDLRIRRAFDHEHARRLANTDGLTGLYNHRYLQERLRQEVERAQRYQRSLSLVMADLDHFKIYNDTYGHPRGDEALIEVAHILRRVSRSSDVVARYGGEEFTLLLPETSARHAEVVATRARERVAKLEFSWERFGAAGLTLSLGIASFCPSWNTKETLIEAADAALYEAKRQGRNRVCIASVPGAPPKSLIPTSIELAAC
ncbi:MAG: diguanylate cyclase [bacterium]|nr:diguanylate cyclase [bacterium]